MSVVRLEVPAHGESRGTAVPRLEHRYVGRFDVIQMVGSGGFGTVYKAHDPQLDRIVALKLLRVGNMATKEQQSRFLARGEKRCPALSPGDRPGA